MASESLLETIAQHEKALVADLERAREESRQVIEAAHAEGAAILQEAAAKLDVELAAMRRDAARAREEERVAIERATAEKVEQIRSESAGKTPQVRKELIARILPGAVQR